MSPVTPDTLARLRAANPARVDPDHGRDPVAQAALARIISDPVTVSAPAGKASRTRVPRRLVLVLAVMLLGAGGAFAATDPLGWWSPNAGEARYGANPALHVSTPTAQQIRCRRAANGVGYRCTAQRLVCRPIATGRFSCAVTGSGLAYLRFDAIRGPVGSSFSRAGFLSSIARSLSKGTLSASVAAKFRTDLARVPDSFFTELRLSSRFGTYGNGSSNSRGQSLVPPPGEPSILVCENAGRALKCQDLNGDLQAPIGAGVYGAEVGPGWRVAPPLRQDTGLPPGVRFTPAEYQVLIDMIRYADVSHSSTSSPDSTSASRP